jgi:thiol:disulfide interchange protein
MKLNPRLMLFGLFLCLFSTWIDAARTTVEILPLYNEAVKGEPFPIGIYLQSDPGWHTYAHPSGDSGMPTSVTWDLPKGVVASDIDWPKPKAFSEEGLTTYGYEGSVLLPVSLTLDATSDLKSTLPLKGTVEWLECNTVCLPQSFDFELHIPVVENVAKQTINPKATALWPEMASFNSTHQAKPNAFWLMILWAFLGGLILNFMPCVFPVIGLKALGFIEQGREDPLKAKFHGLVFTLGVWVSFCALAGVLIFLRAQGEELGWGFQLQSPGFVLALSALLFALAWSLMGVFEIGLSAMNFGSNLSNRTGYKGSFFSGVLATVVATPCTAPFMGVALGFALSQSVFSALIIFSAMALGISAPFLALTCFPSLIEKLPRPGSWMETFKQFTAFPLFATTLWLLSVFAAQTSLENCFFALWSLLGLGFSLWCYGKFCNLGCKKYSKITGWILIILSATGASYLAQEALNLESSAHENQQSLPWEVFSDEKLQSILASGRPVFVNFTAKWCLTCQANLHGPLGSDAVREAFMKANVACLKADWTQRDPKITQALHRLNRSGVPAYALYSPKQPHEPLVLPELLTESILLEAVSFL